MANFEKTNPDSDRISEIQNTEDALRLKWASGTFYRRAKRFHFGGWVVAVVIALLAPVVLLLDLDWGPLLGTAAAVWIFVSRVAFEPARLRNQSLGARVQEQFDCQVLGLEWNWALTRPVSPEEIHVAGKPRKGDEKKTRGWYTFELPVSWPASVVMSQRANAVWGRRQHLAFGNLIVWATGIWFAFGVGLALAEGASLETYLVTLLLPSLPAILDALDLVRAQRNSSEARALVERQTDHLLDEGAVYEDLRELQDQLFALRTVEPLVPEWFYDWKRDEYGEAMAHAAKEIARDQREGSDDPVDR